MKSHSEMFTALQFGKSLTNKTHIIKLNSSGNIIVSIDGGICWKNIHNTNALLHVIEVWEIVQETIQIGNFSVPKPISLNDVKSGDQIWHVDFYSKDNVNYIYHYTDNGSEELIDKCICHLSKDNAKLHAQALLSLTKTN